MFPTVPPVMRSAPCRPPSPGWRSWCTAGRRRAAPPAIVRRPTTRRRSPQSSSGRQLFAGNCASCHGIARARVSAAPRRGVGDAVGLGPSLRGVGALAADFYLRTGYMPLANARDQPERHRALFTEREIRALVAYVDSLGPAGRRSRRRDPEPRHARPGPAAVHRALRRLPPGRRRRAAWSPAPACRRSAGDADADRRGRADRPVRDAPVLHRAQISDRRARLDHRATSHYAQHPRRPRRLGHRPPRPVPGGHRDVAARRRRARRRLRHARRAKARRHEGGRLGHGPLAGSRLRASPPARPRARERIVAAGTRRRPPSRGRAVVALLVAAAPSRRSPSSSSTRSTGCSTAACSGSTLGRPGAAWRRSADRLRQAPRASTEELEEDYPPAEHPRGGSGRRRSSSESGSGSPASGCCGARGAAPPAAHSARRSSRPPCSLGPLFDTGPLYDTPWRRGRRLVDEDGRRSAPSDDRAEHVLHRVSRGSRPRADRRAARARAPRPADARPAAPRARGWAPHGILAYSKICTHAGCAIALYRKPLFAPTEPRPALVCPCHYSTFDPATRRHGDLRAGRAGRCRSCR